ncbi:Latent-transforming growth factor beta-binding protein 2 [Galemys pyrenaicus]|uniref:Latent-transforming growth factor beta-binding protein 2 n=1 Tax=Galemys pyrenaicus TaxID=202257 RepID=A0A8J6A8T2_GALPY|nr:Latent-transforming growth factor beta-binding protein 2 [Galemys pyrenaicus]
MRPATTARCPGRPLRAPWRSLLPLALALFVGMGQAQRDAAGRYESAGRDATRLRSPGGSHPAAASAKVYSLFREQDTPVLGLQPAEQVQPGWGNPRRPAEVERRRPPRAQQPRRVQPPAQTGRSSPLGPPQSAPRTRAAPARVGTLQRPRAAPPTPPRGRITGRNVCGGQCCPGWTTANSTNHCIKPVCQPPCQNRGSCSRPQLCVCRSGFRGARCEEVIPEEEFDPQNSRPAPRRSAEGPPNQRRSSTASESGAGTRPLAPQPPRSLGGLSQSHSSQQHVGLAPTIRLYPAPAASGQLSPNALPAGPGLERMERRDGAQRTAYLDRSSSPWGLNLTEKIKKIKIVFTPTICKQTCARGHCSNSCERGDTTTLYSQGGHGHDPKSGFRICLESCVPPLLSLLATRWALLRPSTASDLEVDAVDFCQIPCLNGGRCVGRDECWCPANSTGKFCHLPAPKLHPEPSERGSHHRGPLGGPLRQSTFTLPLSNQLGERGAGCGRPLCPASVNPSLVKVHINHPPEASVQVHQVARVRGEAEAPEENSVETRPAPRRPAGHGHGHWDSNSIPTQAGETPRPPPPVAPRPRELLGRCYLSAVSGQVRTQRLPQPRGFHPHCPSSC